MQIIFIEEYIINKERKILIVFDDMITGMLSNKTQSNSNFYRKILSEILEDQLNEEAKMEIEKIKKKIAKMVNR